MHILKFTVACLLLTVACFLGVFIAEDPGKRGVRDRWRHLGRAQKSAWASDKARGGGRGAGERETGDRELRVFRGFFAIQNTHKPPARRLSLQ